MTARLARARGVVITSAAVAVGLFSSSGHASAAPATDDFAGTVVTSAQTVAGQTSVEATTAGTTYRIAVAGTGQGTFAVRVAGPTPLTITSPGDRTGDNTPDIGGTCDVGAGPVTVDVAQSRGTGDEVLYGGFSEDCVDGSWLVESYNPPGPPTFLDDASYGVIATQAGGSGVEHIFVVDTQPPAFVAIDVPGAVTNESMPLYQGRASSGEYDDGFVSIRLLSDDGVEIRPFTDHGLSSINEYSYVKGEDQPLSDGTYILEVVQRDDVGNKTTATHAFTVDTTPPDVTITSPTAGQATTDSTPTVAGTASAGPRDHATVQIQLFDARDDQVGDTYEAPVTSGEYSYDVPALAVGTYTVVVIQRDEADNSDTEQRSFSVVAAPVAPAAPAAAAPAAPALEVPASVVLQPRVVVPPSITGLNVARSCVRSATLTAPTPGASGLSFGFLLSQDATVRYLIERRNGSPRWSSCPRRAGTNAGRYTGVANATAQTRSGQRDTKLATTAARRSVHGRMRLSRGRGRVALARIAAGEKLTSGTYILRMTATNANGQSTQVKIKFWVVGR